MSPTLVGLEDVLEEKLRSVGPMDIVELVAELSVPPEQVMRALADLLEGGQVEETGEPGPQGPIYRVSKRARPTG